MLALVYRVLWATPLCWNKEFAGIHTGKGNKNTTKFAKYVLGVHSPFSYSICTFPSSLFWWMLGIICSPIENTHTYNVRVRKLWCTSPCTLSHSHGYPSASFFPVSYPYLWALSLSLYPISPQASDCSPFRRSFKPTGSQLPKSSILHFTWSDQDFLSYQTLFT